MLSLEFLFCCMFVCLFAFMSQSVSQMGEMTFNVTDTASKRAGFYLRNFVCCQSIVRGEPTFLAWHGMVPPPPHPPSCITQKQTLKPRCSIQSFPPPSWFKNTLYCKIKKPQLWLLTCRCIISSPLERGVGVSAPGSPRGSWWPTAPYVV